MIVLSVYHYVHEYMVPFINYPILLRKGSGFITYTKPNVRLESLAKDLRSTVT